MIIGNPAALNGKSLLATCLIIARRKMYIAMYSTYPSTRRRSAPA
jgi:hypothetical protein